MGYVMSFRASNPPKRTPNILGLAFLEGITHAQPFQNLRFRSGFLAGTASRTAPAKTRRPSRKSIQRGHRFRLAGVPRKSVTCETKSFGIEATCEAASRPAIPRRMPRARRTVEAPAQAMRLCYPVARPVEDEKTARGQPPPAARSTSATRATSRCEKASVTCRFLSRRSRPAAQAPWSSRDQRSEPLHAPRRRPQREETAFTEKHSIEPARPASACEPSRGMPRAVRRLRLDVTWSGRMPDRRRDSRPSSECAAPSSGLRDMWRRRWRSRIRLRGSSRHSRQERAAVGVLEFRIAVGKCRPMSRGGCAQERVAHRVDQHVGVGVPASPSRTGSRLRRR